MTTAESYNEIMLTPASQGFRLPAEWERHEATWIGWPHNESDWPGMFDRIPEAYVHIVRSLASGEVVRILVNSATHEESARSLLQSSGIDLSRVEFYRLPTDRGWTRDFAPIFVTRDSPQPGTAALRFRFNGWALYKDHHLDDKACGQICEALNCPIFSPVVGDREVVLEGGSIDGNGRGTIVTTEVCLLHAEIQVRNPGFGREDYERLFRDYFGVTNTLWLGRGLAGDETHGHVDDICRFISPSVVVLALEDDPRKANYHALQENRERLEGMRLENGSKIEVVTVPMPGPMTLGPDLLPGSYANFYIANSEVLVPTFEDPNDSVALGIIRDLFPDRAVVGIHARELILGGGTLHCLTREQPEALRE